MGGGDLDQIAAASPPEHRQQFLRANVLGHELSPAASQQRRVQARHRQVEGHRRVNGHRAPRLDPVSPDGPGEVVDETAVDDHRALGLARGARGVHHVGQVGGDGARGEVVGGFPRHGRPVRIQADRLLAGRGEEVLALLLREEHPDSRILHHEREPFPRIGGVERDVRSTGLPHPQEGDDQLRRAFQGNAHQGVGPDAVPSQEVRDLVRALVRVPDRSVVAARRPPQWRPGCGRPAARRARECMHQETPRQCRSSRTGSFPSRDRTGPAEPPQRVRHSRR